MENLTTEEIRNILNYYTKVLDPINVTLSAQNEMLKAFKMGIKMALEQPVIAKVLLEEDIKFN